MGVFTVAQSRPISQRSRSGKTVTTQINVLAAEYAPGNVIFNRKILDVTKIDGDGGVLINATLFRKRFESIAGDSSTNNVGANANFHLFLFEESIDVDAGEAFEYDSFFNKQPFAIVEFDKDEGITYPMTEAGPIINQPIWLQAQNFIPSSFQCEPNEVDIYAILVQAEPSANFELLSDEIFTLNLSISH